MSRSFSYERYDNRRRPTSSSSRSTVAYWVPLVITVTLAAGGLAAWVWSAREDHESSTHGATSDDDDDLSYGEEARAARDNYGRDDRPPPGSVSEGVVRDDEYGSGGRDGGAGLGGDTFVGGLNRGVQEVYRRTPSPQQAFDSVRKFGAAGVAAAGAVMGGALSAIREESTESRRRKGVQEEGFSDHERWSEEVENKVVSHSEQSRDAVAANVGAFGAALQGGPSSTSKQYTGGRRKTVAIVVSSETMLDNLQDDDGKYHSEHASLLSHLPPLNPATTSLQVLIYNPHPSHKDAPRAPSSIASSYAAINTPGATPGEELASLDPQPYTPGAHTPALSARSSSSDFYDLLYKQAVKLVEDPVNVMAFETPQGWVHMCKHLTPDCVYVVESLAGARGEHVQAVDGWVRQVVVVVGGDGVGLGGLIDTEDEDGAEKFDGKRKEEKKWWVDSQMIGLGKGVDVVDGGRFPEDWERRIVGSD